MWIMDPPSLTPTVTVSDLLIKLFFCYHVNKLWYKNCDIYKSDDKLLLSQVVGP